MLFGEIIDRYFMNRTKQMYVDEILMWSGQRLVTKI